MGAMLSMFERRARRAWRRFRPLPMPQYVAGTPEVGKDELGVHRFRGLTPETLAAAASSPEAAEFVAGVLDKLTTSDDILGLQMLYRSAQGRFRGYWRHVDILTLLWAAATLLQPEAYLEVGVRRGRSAAVVAAACSDCAIYGFDLWQPEYHGAPNPGPGFVRDELRAVEHRGPLELITGDSHQTLPDFLRAHPGLYFDLATIDGDKSLTGAAADYAYALPRLKVGGIVACDDLPWFPDIRLVWERQIMRDRRFLVWQASGYGEAAAAIRIGDAPWW